MAPLKIGITGGIGSGKTFVCNLFEKMGVPVYSADDNAKMLTNTDPEIRKRLTNLFGNEIYVSENQLNKQLLAQHIFSNKNKLEQVNNIIHPRVAEHFNQWVLNNSDKPYIIKEAAIMFESGANKYLDAVVLVYAPIEMRLQRAMSRDNADEKAIQNRMRNQMNEEKKRELADFVLMNDEKQMLLPQIVALHNKFSKGILR